MRNNYIYIAVMFSVTFLIRVLPMILLRERIKSRFIRSFLYYVPYVTLAVMTFPAIIEASDKPLAGWISLAVGVVLGWLNAGIFPTAVACSVTLYLAAALL